MGNFLIKRSIQLIFTLWILSLIVFIMIRVAPGNPVINFLGPQATEELISSYEEKWGLDKSIIVQYKYYLEDIVQGDFGDSLFYQEKVSKLLLQRLPASLQLASITLLMIIIFGIPLGIFSALHPDTICDFMVRGFVYIGQAIPDFWLGIVLIIFLGVTGILPTYGRGTLAHLILPVLALGIPKLARVVRYSRTGMLEVIREDYIRTARSKGLAETVVIYKHALRNLLIALVTDVGLTFVWLIGGSVIIEVVFAWPGIGKLLITAVQNRDFPLAQGTILLFASGFLVINMLIDITYSLINPKIEM